jgi:DNA-binding NarL/FixJ family response regulator
MSSAKEINIVIADDHPWVMEGINTIIADNTNYKVVSMVTDGDRLLHVLNSHRVDLILLDLNLPVVTGLEAAEKIKKDFAHIKIIVITTYEDPKIINTLKTLGVEGYLPKASDAQQLLQAIQRVLRGETVYFERKKEEVPPPIAHDHFADKFKLTKRELEVMRHIADGRTTKEIADKLFLSELTVHTHRKNISHKIGFSDPLAIAKFLSQNMG